RGAGSRCVRAGNRGKHRAVGQGGRKIVEEENAKPATENCQNRRNCQRIPTEGGTPATQTQRHGELPMARIAIWQFWQLNHFGAMRMAPSIRMVSPLIMLFSTMCWTS